jgi:hypothetical protein
MDLMQRYPVSGRPRLRDRHTGLTRPSHIRVRAANERIRLAMKHGVTGVGFMPDIGQSVEWPFDQFTKRRILKGDVTIDEGASGGEAAAEIFKRHKITVKTENRNDAEQPHGRSPRRKTAETLPPSSST